MMHHQDTALKRQTLAEGGVEVPQGKTLFGQFEDLGGLTQEIHQHLKCSNQKLEDMSRYYFDGKGKAMRPALTLIMARACNSHLKVRLTLTLMFHSTVYSHYVHLQLPHTNTPVSDPQRKIAIICEMFHTSSLLHDDVIDHAETRRGKQSVNTKWTALSSIHAGVYILSISTKLLAQTNNPEVMESMSQILYDLVNGEFQQMTSRTDKDDRFQLYLDKTFNKTASLTANACKSVAILANHEGKDKQIVDMAYRYGQNIGIAFQLVDDWLDFVSSAELLGKPSAADLKLGLATAPVLFASEEFSELNTLILRRFSQPGDAEAAFNLVCRSEGLSQTKLLAEKYKNAAMENIKNMKDSEDKEKLTYIANKVISRMN